VAVAERRWSEAGEDFAAAPADDPDALTAILSALDHVSDDSAQAVRAIEAYVAVLPDGPDRARILGAREAVERGQGEWARIASPVPPELNARIHQLSEEALDVQRELATLRRRVRFRPDDHDRAQLAWLDAALSRSVRERPDAWRIVYLHHPLYTTITNHCERADVIGLRDNILALLQKHDVHLVLSGHSHAFEWFRSSALPHVGVFVSGGGGQISLRPSLFESRRFVRYRGYYESLRANGVQECAMTGLRPGGPVRRRKRPRVSLFADRRHARLFDGPAGRRPSSGIGRLSPRRADARPPRPVPALGAPAVERARAPGRRDPPRPFAAGPLVGRIGHRAQGPERRTWICSHPGVALPSCHARPTL
jgi:hypothetical protein